MPADAHPLSGAPGAHAFADRVNHPDHFMTGNTRIGDGVRPAFLHDTITVADTAGFHFDAHLIHFRLRKRSLDQFKRTTRLRHLYRFHCGHISLPFLGALYSTKNDGVILHTKDMIAFLALSRKVQQSPFIRRRVGVSVVWSHYVCASPGSR